MNKIEIVKNVKEFVEDESWFHMEEEIHDYDGDENFNDLTFSTRYHGNVGDETYGQKDWDEGERLLVLIMEKFGHHFQSYELTTFDEWVNLELILK